MKRIVLCADGTWNVRDQLDKQSGKRRPTNVTKVARAIMPRSNGVDQVVFYHDGLGTAGPLDRFTGGAFGDGIEKNVRELYRCVVYNYEPGDELYLFGFSRGAFTVRTLAGFMNRVGLVQKDDDFWLPEIYECYQEGNGPETPEWKTAFRRMEGEQRPCPQILFLGVWDTVGALGAPGLIGKLFNPKRYKNHDVTLNANISHAYQALAIDEHRKPFAPSVWDRPAGWSGILEQAWFAGAHSDVGGSESPDGLANQALHWMVEKAEGLGLEFENRFLDYYRPCFNGQLHDSMTGVYHLLGSLNRQIGGRGTNGEGVHRSALDRRAFPACAYHSENIERYLSSGPSVPYETSRVPTRIPC